MSPVGVVLGLLVYVACIVGARRVAVAKGRQPGWWALSAMLVGPVALLLVALAPARKLSAPARTVSS